MQEPTEPHHHTLADLPPERRREIASMGGLNSTGGFRVMSAEQLREAALKGARTRHARRQQVEACIETLLEEARLSSQTVPLFQAAIRLQGRARDAGVVLGFDQALYCLRKRDLEEVFVRSEK